MLTLWFLCCLASCLKAASPHNSLAEVYKSGLKDTALANALLNCYLRNYATCIDSLPRGQEYLQMAYGIFLKNQDYKGVADVTFQMGSAANVFLYYNKALEYSFLSLKYSELSRDNNRKGRAYRNIGLIYYMQRRWNEAYNYFQKSIELISGNNGGIKLSVPVYLSGLCLIELGRCNEALISVERAFKLALKDGDTLRIHECKVARGRALSCLGKTDEAMALFRETLKFYERDSEHNALSSIYLEIAKIYDQLNETDQALKYAGIAYNNDRVADAPIYRIDITRLLWSLYQKKGENAIALRYAEEYNTVKDSQISRDLLAEIAVAQARFEFKKTEDRINSELAKNESNKRRANIVIMLFSVVFVAGSIAFFSVRRERKRSDQLLLNILPKNTAEELKKHGTALPKSHPGVSIMFCDVESFTKISEQLSAENLVNMLNYYFGEFDRIIGDLRIEKIKTIGDAYMCVLGLENEPDHAVRMVTAALRFQEFLNKGKKEIEDRFGLFLNFRIGIHSGPVVSGVVGSKKYAYDIWGDSVNIAARMEETSVPGKINISENTFHLVQHAFNTTYRGEISAKNKGAMKMYFVDSYKSPQNQLSSASVP